MAFGLRDQRSTTELKGPLSIMCPTHNKLSTMRISNVQSIAFEQQVLYVYADWGKWNCKLCKPCSVDMCSHIEKRSSEFDILHGKLLQLEWQCEVK